VKRNFGVVVNDDSSAAPTTRRRANDENKSVREEVRPPADPNRTRLAFSSLLASFRPEAHLRLCAPTGTRNSSDPAPLREPRGRPAFDREVDARDHESRKGTAVSSPCSFAILLLPTGVGSRQSRGEKSRERESSRATTSPCDESGRLETTIAVTRHQEIASASVERRRGEAQRSLARLGREKRRGAPVRRFMFLRLAVSSSSKRARGASNLSSAILPAMSLIIERGGMPGATEESGVVAVSFRAFPRPLFLRSYPTRPRGLSTRLTLRSRRPCRGTSTRSDHAHTRTRARTHRAEPPREPCERHSLSSSHARARTN